MRILFMGTPDFALEILKALFSSGEDIVGVVTQPDKPKGRGHKTVASPVKLFAEKNGITVFQPDTLKNGAFSGELRAVDPDMIVVAAYGKILPEYIIDYPRYGCICAHGSLLPKYRGAAPIQRALMNGETVTGVTAIYMDKGIDTGDMILAKEVEIGMDDNFETLHDKMAAAGADVILKTVAAARLGRIERTKQDDSASTYAEKITKEDRLIDFSKKASDVYNKIRGLSPFPRAFTYMPDGKMLQITRARIVNTGLENENTGENQCGLVEDVCRDGFTVVCGTGSITVLEVIPEGKGRMSALDLINGRRISKGDVLGIGNGGK